MADTAKNKFLQETRGGHVVKLSKRIYPGSILWSAISEAIKDARIVVDEDGENWIVWVEGNGRKAMEIATRIFSKGMDEGMLNG